MSDEAQKPEPSSLLKASTYVLIMLVGGLGALLYLEMGATSDAHSRIKRLEADNRTAWGKYHAQGEEISDMIEAARNEHTLELWAVQGKLDACLNRDKR